MKDQFKTMMIGIFVIAALSVIVYTIFFIHPFLGDEGTLLRVRFADIDKVNVGTRVTFAGKAIGEVISIQEVSDFMNKREGKKGEIFPYELTLSVDSNTKIFNSDRIFLRTSGLLGERSVAIDPEPPKPGEKLRVVNDEILYAQESGSVEETFQQFKQVANRLNNVLDMVSDALDELQEKKTWDHLAGAVKNIDEFTANINGSWETIDASINDLASTLANTKDVSEQVVKGKGSVGKIFMEDDLYLRTTALLNKGGTILDDINHYGILFHLDKGWQRLRARRMNLLQKLCTPQQFQNFFNDELDEINTSLARVSMVLDKTLCMPPYQCLEQDCEFQKVFADLFRRVQGLEESLKLYNIQVMDVKKQETELMER